MAEIRENLRQNGEMPTVSDVFDDLLHRNLAREDDTELSDHARHHIRRNAAVFIGANGLQNIADQGAKASTVLPWIMAASGAPAWMTGLLVPIRESGSMLPQAALQPWVLGKQRRAGVWILGALGQSLGAAVIALACAFARGVSAGVLVLAGLAVLALSRSLTSIASKDIQGRTMPKGMRGRVSGFSTMISGIVAITVGLAVRVYGGSDTSTWVLAGIVFAASACWALAAWLFGQIAEDDAPAHHDDAAHTNWRTEAWELLRDDADFRRFVVVRALLLVSALAPPFVVHLSAQGSGSHLSSVAMFIIASGLAALLGGRVSGMLSDRSSRQTMMWGAAIASLIVVGFVISLAIDPLASSWWWGPAVFFMLSLVHTAVRVGRKTYVVDMATGDQRTRYVAVSNTAIGVLLLVTGALSSALMAISAVAALIFLAGLGFAGVIVGRTLPEVSAH